MNGPLHGVRVVEFAGIGPGPLAGMLLADMGADVVVVDRPVATGIAAMVPREQLLTNRGKRLTTADLKTPAGRSEAGLLAARADVVLEGFRPGTMERLGLGPEVLLTQNPRLVYCRLTGWGQAGPRAATAGHDINYIAVTGALAALGRAGGPPTPPMNLLGDFAGGTMFAVTGILAALLEVERSGQGQVVDVAMTDGVGALLAPYMGMVASGRWAHGRGENLLDTGAPFYDVYEAADGRYLAIGALEDPFFAALAAGLGLSDAETAGRWDEARWPALRARIEAVVKTRTRDEWMTIFAGTDACVAPVLELDEAVSDAGNQARAAFVTVADVRHPAPAPRFGRTPCRPVQPPPVESVPLGAILDGWRR